MAQHADNVCESVRYQYYASVRDGMQDWMDTMWVYERGRSGYTGIEAFNTVKDGLRQLRVELTKVGGAVEAYGFVFWHLAQVSGGVYAHRVRPPDLVRAIGSVVCTQARDESWNLGFPDRRVTWTNVIDPVLRAFLDEVAYVPFGWGNAADISSGDNSLHIRYRVGVGRLGDWLAPVIIAVKVGAATVVGNVTSVYGATSADLVPPSPGGAMLDVGGIALAVRDLAKLDTDIALNGGEVIYSVRSKEVTEP